MTIATAYSSPRIDRLRADLAGGKPGALAVFWQQIHEQGTPLMEAIPNDDRHVLVNTATFPGHPLRMRTRQSMNG